MILIKHGATMRNPARFFTHLTLIAALLPACSIGATDLHELVKTTYNFRPRDLNDDQLNKKSAELDRVWTSVTKDKAQQLPALRNELARTDQSPFFYYDGSKLLLSLSNETADRQLALASIERTELRDVQFSDYFHTIHWFAKLGFDTTNCALKILAESKFQVFVPQHALTLGQDYCLVYMLLPTEEKFYLEKLGTRLKSETEAKAQQSLILMLWYTVTREGDKAIAEFLADPNKDTVSRQKAKEMLALQAGTAAKIASLLSGSYDSLKQKRRERMASVSDEALLDLDSITLKIRAKFR